MGGVSGLCGWSGGYLFAFSYSYSLPFFLSPVLLGWVGEIGAYVDINESDSETQNSGACIKWGVRWTKCWKELRK